MALKKKKTVALFATVLIGLVTLFGCSDEEEVLTVAAASDLHYAFTEVGQMFEEETGIKVEFNFGSTGLLAQQIENGAPIDVFAAANIAYVEKLAARDLVVEDSRAIYARGRIVLVKEQGDELEIDWKQLINGNWELLLQQSIRNVSIANPSHAPYGLAAKEFLQTAGLWEDVEDRLVYGNNVNDALALVTSGNAEVGVVALSLVMGGETPYHVLPEDLHNPMEQEMAVVKHSSAQDESAQFVEFVTGPVGREVLAQYGFEMP